MDGLEPVGQIPREEESYLASVSDLMVGLLFVFIIVLSAFGLSYRVSEHQATLTETRAKEAEEQALAARADLDEAGRAALDERERYAAEIDSLEAERGRLQAEVASLTAQRREVDALTSSLSERDAARRGMLQRVKDLMAERDVDIAIEPENGILRLPEALLFESGEAVLREDGERALRELAYVLARALPCYARAPPETQLDCVGGAEPILETVLVEGHTDDRPISGGGVEDNWALAAQRGANTFKALVRYEPSLELLFNPSGEALLGVSSYEARRPVVDADTPEARRLNRRIDLRFVVAAPSSAELADIRRRIGQGAP